MSGTAVAMTAEACSLVSGTTYQVTNAAKRIIDPATAVTVKDAGTPIAAANVTIDYLFGRFTLASAPGGAVTVDASYLPTTTIAEAKSVDLNVAVDLVDSTSFDSAGSKRKTAVLLDISGSLMRLALPLDALDGAAGGTQSIDSWLKAGTPRLIDVLFTTGARLRAWVLFKSYKVTGQLAGIIEVTVEFEGASQGGGAAFNTGT